MSTLLLNKFLLLLGLPCYQFFFIYCRNTLHYLLPYFSSIINDQKLLFDTEAGPSHVPLIRVKRDQVIMEIKWYFKSPKVQDCSLTIGYSLMSYPGYSLRKMRESYFSAEGELGYSTALSTCLSSKMKFYLTKMKNFHESRCMHWKNLLTRFWIILEG